METQTLALPYHPNKDYRSNVDTSRPFRSVKEAVAIFGERFLVGEIYSAKPFSFNAVPQNEMITSWNYQPTPDNDGNSNSYDGREQSGDQDDVLDTLRKLEAELEATKMELMLLKKRESETEIALANLNAELHKNMSKLAEAEAAAGAEKVTTAVACRTRTSFESGSREEERRRRSRVRKENSSTLAQILSVKENDCFGGRKEIRTKNMMKKKPIMPLVTDLFKKKGSSPSSTVLHSTLYQSPNMYFN